MFHFLFTVFLLCFPCALGSFGQDPDDQLLIQSGPSWKRSRSKHGLSYLNFVVHKFQHLQGSLLDSFCKVVQEDECAFTCVDNAHCVSFNIALSPNENGKFRCELLSEDMFRSPEKMIASQQFHHYSIKVSDNLKYGLTFSHCCVE